jgi:hypothetical protein
MWKCPLLGKVSFLEVKTRAFSVAKTRVFSAVKRRATETQGH